MLRNSLSVLEMENFRLHQFSVSIEFFIINHGSEKMDTILALEWNKTELLRDLIVDSVVSHAREIKTSLRENELGNVSQVRVTIKWFYRYSGDKLQRRVSFYQFFNSMLVISTPPLSKTCFPLNWNHENSLYHAPLVRHSKYVSCWLLVFKYGSTIQVKPWLKQQKGTEQTNIGTRWFSTSENQS